MPDRFRPDAAVRRVSPLAGTRAHTVIVDDPIVVEEGRHYTAEEARAKARALFEDHGPTAGEGRRSFPRSHRGEGRNFVD